MTESSIRPCVHKLKELRYKFFYFLKTTIVIFLNNFSNEALTNKVMKLLP